MFAMETICSGTFLDSGHKVTTIVVRLSQDALDEYLDAKGWGETSADFDSHDEWLAHCAAQTAKMEKFKDKVCRTCGVDRSADGYSGSVKTRYQGLKKNENRLYARIM